MRFTHLAAALAAALLCGLPICASAQSGGSEVGSFPNAAPLNGSERILADQSATTVNLTPAQIASFLGIPNGLPAFVANDCLSNNGSSLLWIGCGSGGVPGGSSYSIQYNNASVFGGLLPGSTGTWCFNWSSLSAAPTLVSCGSGTVTSFEVNGTGLSSSTAVNFENSAATDGLTLSFSNPSAGNVQLGLSGALTNAGLANPATTVNTETCTLGSTCTIPFDINSSALTSQAGLNFITSTTNSVGLTATPSNPGTNEVKWEITGSNYTGNAATATALATTPSLCGSGQAAQGITPVGDATGCFTPTGSGTVNSGTSGYVAYYAVTGPAVSQLSLPTLQADLITANAVTYAPTLGSGATNDWDPTSGAGIATAGVVYATPNAAGSTIDGILAGSDKQQVLLCDAAALGTNAEYIILENQSSSETTAANQLWGAGNQALGPQMCVMLTYLVDAAPATYSTTLTAGVNGSATGYCTTSTISTCSFGSISSSALGAYTLYAAYTASDQSVVYVCGSSAPPPQGWLRSVTFNGQTFLESTATYGTNSNCANWVWASSSFGFTSGSMYPGDIIAGSASFWEIGRVQDGGTPATEPLGTVSSVTPDQSFRTVMATASQSAITVNAPTDGTPQNGQRLELDIVNYSTVNAYTWNAAYAGNSTVSLPTAGQTASKLDRFYFSWDAAESTWDLLAYALGR